MRDYSSDLDPTSSSPVKASQSTPYKRKRPLLEKMAGRAAKKGMSTNDEVARTTKYDVVGVVKSKVVFSKRCVTHHWNGELWVNSA
jgi:hypothetical protein